MSTGPAKKQAVRPLTPPKQKPKKRRGKPRGKQTAVQQQKKGIVPVLGGKGQDMTAGATTSAEGMKDQLRVASTQQEMAVICTINVRTLANLAMGAVLLAIKHGWLSSIRNGEQPYYAFRYIYNVFVTALTSAPPLNSGAPEWMWQLLAALKPKRGSFKTGTVDYSWLVEQTNFPPLPTYQYTAAPSYYVCWGGPDPVNTINGYPVIIPGNASLYDDTLGSSSFTSMCKFLPQGPLNRVVTSIDDRMMTLDTSAFSVVYPELGNSLDTPGALAQTIYSERVIQSPILAKFALYQPSGENYRGWFKAGKCAGSPTYIIPRMAEMSRLPEIRDKVSPIFCFYNFDEFFYTLSLIVARAIELASESNGQSVTACPLSSQTVQFLLRQSIFGVFANYMAQDLYLTSANSSLYTMVPFSAGPNGVSFTSSKMLLPTVLAENIRCCQRKLKQLEGPKGPAIFDMVTILARPAQQSQLANFTTTVASVPLVYTPNPLELPTDIIDCSYQSNTGTQYFSPTGDVFEKQVVAWNGWILGLSGSLSPLVSMTTEGGASALLTSVYTRSQINNADAFKVQPKIKKEDSRKKILSREEQYIQMFTRAIGAGPVAPTYLDMNVEKETISNQPPSSPVWKFISLFILPVFLSNQEADQASIQAWQTFQIQPYLVPSDTIAGGAGNVGATIYPQIASRLQKLAELDVKSNNQQQNSELVEELMALTRLGRGGFFADIAGGLANTFLPGLGGTVSNLVSKIGL